MFKDFFGQDFDVGGAGFGGQRQQRKQQQHQSFGGFDFGNFGFGQQQHQQHQQQHQQRQPPLYSKHDGIVPLSKAKYPDSKSKYVWLVQFYSARSQDAVAFKEKFVKLANRVKMDGIRVGSVNCDVENELCLANKVTQRTTFKLVYGKDSAVYDPSISDDKTLTSKSLFTFVTEKMPGSVFNIRHRQQAEELLSTLGAKRYSSNVALFYFTQKFDTPILVKNLAHIFEGAIAVGEIRGSNDKLSAEFGVTQYPALLAVCGGKEFDISEAFTGNLKDHSSLEKFAEKFKANSKNACDKIRKVKQADKEKRKQRIKQVKKITEAQLKAMKMPELKELFLDLNIGNKGLLEKSEFVAAILKHIHNEL